MLTVPKLETHLRDKLGFNQGELVEIQGQYAGYLSAGFNSGLSASQAVVEFNEVVRDLLSIEGAQRDCANGETLTKLVFNDGAARKERFTVTLTLSLVQNRITAIFS